MAVVLSGDIHLKKDKTTNIKIRITQNRKVEYISTDLYVNPNNFLNGNASGKNATFINSRIRDEIEKYYRRYLKLGSLGERYTAKELKDILSVEDQKIDIDFLTFIDGYLTELKNENKSGSVRALQSLITHLKKFRTTINFSDINLNFLNEFQKYLKNQGVGNSINNYMRYFRLVFNKGRDKYNDDDRGIVRIPNYPFKKFKIMKTEVKTREYSLTLEQLKLFRDYEPTRERQKMAHDMFLLLFYLIGINTKDLYFLGLPDKDNRVNYSRAKTGRKYSLKLEPEALVFINVYKSEERLISINQWYKSHLDWQKYMNIELKSIGTAIQTNLRKVDPKATYPLEISTNWARHTWATIARNVCRIDKDDVALCLGHEDSDNMVTDIYINYDYSIIDESNRKVLDALKEIKVDSTNEKK